MGKGRDAGVEQENEYTSYFYTYDTTPLCDTQRIMILLSMNVGLAFFLGSVNGARCLGSAA